MGKRKDEDLYNLVTIQEASPGVRGQLRALIAEAQSLIPCVKRLKDVRDELKELVLANGIANEQGLFGARDGNFYVVIGERSGGRTLSREMLIENGVSPGTIEASMKQGKASVTCELGEIGKGASDW